MRWFIVFLLIANILLFFWVQQEALRPSPQDEIPPPEIGELRLRSAPPAAEVALVAEPEVQADDTVDVPPSLPVEPVVADVEVQVPVTATPDDEAQMAGGPGAPRPTGPPETPAVPADEKVPEMVEAAPVVKPEVPPLAVQGDVGPPADSGLAVSSAAPIPQDEAAMVQEAPASSQPTEAPAETPPAVVAEAEPTRPAYCARIGPFDPADADALLQGLPGRFELLSDTSEEQTIDDGYYVLIPALPDRATGLAKLEELKAAGFEDTWLFRRGAYRNAISLGLFRRQGGANRHAASVAAEGFEVEVRERTTTAEKRWLQLKQVGEGDMLSAVTLPDGVTLVQQDCP